MPTRFDARGSVPLLAFVLYLSIGASAEPQREAAPIPARERATALLDSIASSLPKDSRGLNHLRWLRESIPTRQGLEIPQTAIKGLESLDEALRLAKTLPEADARRIREMVEADLEVKATYCRSHPDGMAAVVPLTVRTWVLQGELRSEARQWDVLVISAPLAGFPGRKGEPFPELSSPTTKPLAPGRYVIWAQDPQNATRRSPEKDVTVGAPGVPPGAVVSADLVVPPR